MTGQHPRQVAMVFERVPAALLGGLPPLQDDDLIGLLNRGQSVGNADAGDAHRLNGCGNHLLGSLFRVIIRDCSCGY